MFQTFPLNLTQKTFLWCQQKTLSYGKLRLNHHLTWISWRDSLLGFCIVTPPLSALWNVFDENLRVPLCEFVYLCHQLHDDTERQMSHLWVCWQVPYTLTFPAVVLEWWVALLTPLANHKRGEHTDAGLLRIQKIELTLNCLAPLPLWSFPSSV